MKGHDERCLKFTKCGILLVIYMVTFPCQPSSCLSRITLSLDNDIFTKSGKPKLFIVQTILVNEDS